MSLKCPVVTDFAFVLDNTLIWFHCFGTIEAETSSEIISETKKFTKTKQYDTIGVCYHIDPLL